MIAVLLVVVLLVVGLIHWYLWKRLVKDTTRTRRARVTGSVVAVLLALVIPTTLALSRALPHSRQPIVAWPGFLWLALMFYLLVTLLLLEIPRLAIRLWQRRTASGSGALAGASPSAVPNVRVGSADISDADVGAGRGHDRAAHVVVPNVSANSADISDDQPREAPDGTAGRGAVPNVRANRNDISDGAIEGGAVEGDRVEGDRVEGDRVGGGAAFAAEPPSARAEAAVEKGFDPARRLLLGRSLAITAGALSVGAVGIGVYQAMSAPNLKRVPIRLAKLPPSMDGFRIAVVSDIHLGPLLGRSHTERIVRMINSVDADLVAVVGDLVDGSVAELGAAAEPLQDLRGKHGSFFVTGNHEYFSGYQEWVDEVNSLGVRVLRNERVDVLGLDLAGVNDLSGEDVGDGPDFAKALDGRDADRPVVLLAHQPIQAHEAAERGVDLQLSGHTHGGQMVPFNLLVGLQQPVVAGLGQVDGTQVYVTRGAGFWGPPVRFGAPPDISIVELRAG